MLGEYKQLDLFEVEYETKVKSKYQNIKNKLSKYSIDKIYEKEFKSNGCLLREIYERLSKQKDYKEYYKDLIEELTKIIPIVSSEYSCKDDGIYEIEQYNYRYRIGKHEVNGVKYLGSSGPLYCLDMIPKALLGAD